MIAMCIIIRSLFFGLYALQNVKLKLIMATLLLVFYTGYHSYTHPNKNKLVNIQELLLLINLTIMYAVSYQGNDDVFSIVTNVMISLAFFQFCMVVFYHFLTYTCRCNILAMIETMKEKLQSKKNPDNENSFVKLLNIPECAYRYAEYQDGLITDDFVQNN